MGDILWMDVLYFILFGIALYFVDYRKIQTRWRKIACVVVYVIGVVGYIVIRLPFYK